MERKNLRNRVLAAILAGTMGLPLAACDEEKIREEYEKEKQEVYGDFDEKLEQQKDEIVKSILAELQGTTMPETTATTTYTTELTNTTSTTNTTTKIQTTEQTSQTSTTITTNNTTIQPTTTTTTKTATVSNNNEPTISDFETSYKVLEREYIISDEYVVKSKASTVSCNGEGLFSIVCKLNGTYDEKVQEEIMKLNHLSETFVAEGTKLKVPYTLVYCKGRSAELIANFAGVSINDVEKMNDVIDRQEMYPEEKYLLVKVLDKNEKKYKTLNGETQNVICDTVIKGDTVIECKNQYEEDSVYGVLCLKTEEKNKNVVEYTEIKKDGSYVGCVVAQNANYITTSDGYPVIICNNEADMYVKYLANSKTNQEDYRTIIPKQFFTNEYYMYKSDDGTVAVAFSNIDIPGFKQYNVIGGKQKTIG